MEDLITVVTAMALVLKSTNLISTRTYCLMPTSILAHHTGVPRYLISLAFTKDEARGSTQSQAFVKEPRRMSEEHLDQGDDSSNGHGQGSSPSAAATSSTTTGTHKRMRSASVPSESRLLELSVPLETRLSHQTVEDKLQRTERIADAVRELISCLGEDPEREGLLDTPKRAAEAFMFWTKGYEENLVRSCQCHI